MDLFELIRNGAGDFGLNLIAAVSAQRYDLGAAPDYRALRIFPECRSIVVVGNGGGDFWQAFRAHTKASPGWLARDNPLDDFTRSVVEEQLVVPIRSAGRNCVPVYPFDSGSTLNFMQLAMLAGLAGPSIIGVVVHPSFGPWIAFRAALLLDCIIDYPGDAAGFDPCPTCRSRACISACPANAVSFPSGWDIQKCLVHRVEAAPDCDYRCHARAACVLSPDQRYPDDELAYHQARALRVMRPHYEKVK